MIAGWCGCSAPAHVEYLGVLYCYECGRKAVAEHRRSKATRSAAGESSLAGGNAAGAVDPADSQGEGK